MEESAYIEAYSSLSKLEEKYLKPIKWTVRGKLYECMEAIDPYWDEESQQKEVDKLLKPYDRFLENIMKMKGQLLIKEKERLDRVEKIPRLDSYVEDSSEENKKPLSAAVAKKAEELGEVGGMKVTDVSVVEGHPSVSLTATDDTPKKKRGRKKKTEDLPDGIYPTAADMAMEEKDFDKK